MTQVGPERLECFESMRVDGLEYELASRLELLVTESEERRKVSCARCSTTCAAKMTGNEASGCSRKKVIPSSCLDVPLREASLDHSFIGIDAKRRHTGVTKQIQELAASAADLDHPL